ncbi:YlxP-like protein [Olavius algarvensis associated proteobacterium Delta 3]|nr:YlxP-like protein [Olavius algarvensis associated proteobacterium Delta 3]CAB5127077.1 YlxP-like protein [Olavius algarvensis associated proteobacterium Delta 3]
MVIGLGIITFRIHDCRSLKGKRKIVKAIINRIQNRFNVSIAEVGANDIYQRAEIGFALVGNSRPLINSKIDKIFNLAEDLGLAEIVDSEMEIMTI